MRDQFAMIRWGRRITLLRWLGIGFIVSLVGVVCVITIGRSNLGPMFPWLFIGFQILVPLVFVSQVIAFLVSQIGATKMKREVIATRGHMCPKCAYNLTARPPSEHTCPECGLVCPRRECVRLWCKLLRSRI